MNESNMVVEIELDPAQLEQILSEIAELRAEVARLSAEVANRSAALDLITARC